MAETPDLDALLLKANAIVAELMNTGTGENGKSFRAYVDNVASKTLDQIATLVATMPSPASSEDATHMLYAVRELEKALRTCAKNVADIEKRLVEHLDRTLQATGQCRTGDLTLTIRSRPKAPDLALRSRDNPELYDAACDVLGIKPEFRQMEVIRFFHPGVEKLTDYLIENGMDVPYVPPGTPNSVPSIQIRRNTQ